MDREICINQMFRMLYEVETCCSIIRLFDVNLILIIDVRVLIFCSKYFVY